MLVLGDAGVAVGSGEALFLEGVEGLADLLFVEVKDGVAAGALVACVDECVQRERIVLGRGDLFFDESAEDAELDLVEVHIYKSIRLARVAESAGDNDGHLCRLRECCF